MHGFCWKYFCQAEKSVKIEINTWTGIKHSDGIWQLGLFICLIDKKNYIRIEIHLRYFQRKVHFENFIELFQTLRIRLFTIWHQFLPVCQLNWEKKKIKVSFQPNLFGSTERGILPSVKNYKAHQFRWRIFHSLICQTEIQSKTDHWNSDLWDGEMVFFWKICIFVYGIPKYGKNIFYTKKSDSKSYLQWKQTKRDQTHDAQFPDCIPVERFWSIEFDRQRASKIRWVPLCLTLDGWDSLLISKWERLM